MNESSGHTNVDNENLEIITEVFSQFMTQDADDSGQPTIPTANVIMAMEGLGLDVSNPETVSLVIQTLDPNDKGFAEYESFVEIMSLYLDELTIDSKDNSDRQHRNVMELFKLFTNGKEDRPICLKDLKRVSSQIKDAATDDELLDMLYLSGKSHVDFQSFEKIVMKANVL